ncbi:uncharacterized protein LOC123301677 [Chrysoperla carnea]|uniref:uncharacterized protein LOC123301677 n=1 Tax=Chrysoperla carnea TaxID=189513 RepID=UPI001D092D9F|nr:uncharacterized protein LOC123301677 [Chrysoperla carnea]
MEMSIQCLKLFICVLLTQNLLNVTNSETLSTATVDDEDHSHTNTNTAVPHSRQKRLLWVTEDGRIALPPGTTLVITPSLSLPFIRYPPDGFFSNMSIALPITIDFNKLGLTDNQNPYGVVPPLLARSMGRATGSLLGSYIRELFSRRKKRDTTPIEIPEQIRNELHGGERALLFTVVEDLLSNFGMDGKACLLRAICEVHSHPLHNFGLFGEVLKLFLSASKSPYSDYLTEYVEAERAGAGFDDKPPGECWPYLKQCPKSLFRNSHNLYSKESNEVFHESENTNSIIEDEDNQNEEDAIRSSNVMLNVNKPPNM